MIQSDTTRVNKMNDKRNFTKLLYIFFLSNLETCQNFSMYGIQILNSSHILLENLSYMVEPHTHTNIRQINLSSKLSFLVINLTFQLLL